MAVKLLGVMAIVLLAAGLLLGCAGGPPRPAAGPGGPLGPLPSGHRNAREVALEQALGDFYGAPYRSGGSDPGGVDCSGLVQAMYHRAGVNVPRTVAQQFDQGQSVAPRDLRFGDVVFFNRYCQTRGGDFFMAGIIPPMFNTSEVCHDGIYLGEGRFVHASPRGVVVSRLDAEVWRVSFRGARRYLPNP